jgi:membrane-bound inhibitor of C-type lysozyme
MNAKGWTWTVIILIVAIVGVFLIERSHTAAPSTTATSTASQLVATASYSCDAGKAITASYYSGPSTPAANANQPPTPGGSVMLNLSDGRTMTLPQTISADGARYASTDGTIVFWNKGNGLTFTENNQATYTGCIQVANDPGGLSQVYENGTEGFSLRYPTGYSVDATYKYQEMGPGKDISGVKFTIPAATAAGTNLSSDSYMSVEEIPQTQTCSANLFLGQGSAATTVTDSGTTYSVASSSDAAAGNRYVEMVYAIPGTNPCVAVRYFIHYGAFENYPAGTVKQFDQAALIAQFDSIRRTLTIGQ